jgi:hypothetical protein
MESQKDAAQMNSKGRPVSVTAVAWLFIAVGVGAFILHSPDLLRLQKDALPIEFTELLSVLAGVFMLRRQNWARWLALAWMAFHVVITAYPPFHGLVVHVLIFSGIAYLLLRSDAAKYFRGADPA